MNLSTKYRERNDRLSETGQIYMSAVDNGHMKVRTAVIEDQSRISSLYRRVAAIPGGIARLEDEVTEQYIHAFLSRAILDGIGLVATDDSGKAVAEIHAYRPGPYCFSHVLSDLTIVVDPKAQGQGLGRLVFDAFLQIVSDDLPDISRVELIARQSNQSAIKFYKSLGFVEQGEMTSRILNVDGSLESDIPMAWFRQ